MAAGAVARGPRAPLRCTLSDAGSAWEGRPAGGPPLRAYRVHGSADQAARNGKAGPAVLPAYARPIAGPAHPKNRL